MITSLTAKDFKGIPYLEGSQLMQHHQGTIQFSTTKPNLIVGPNGTGKSALLNTLAILTLSHMTGVTRLDRTYTSPNHGGEVFWTQGDWRSEWTWLKGLAFEGRLHPTIYYRPNHVPGNEKDATYAMMTGYWEESKVYRDKTRHLSSGQRSHNLMDDCLNVLAGTLLEPARFKWDEPKKVENPYRAMPWDITAEILVTSYRKELDLGANIVLMDEPEQSLDTVHAAMLFQIMKAMNPRTTQVVCSTHSVWPLLHTPDAFNFIEAEPGYMAYVRSWIPH